MQQPIGECYENGYSGVCEEPIICFRKRTVMNISKVISQEFFNSYFPERSGQNVEETKINKM